MTVLSMSRVEIDRLHVLRDVLGERISVREPMPLSEAGFAREVRDAWTRARNIPSLKAPSGPLPGAPGGREHDGEVDENRAPEDAGGWHGGELACQMT